MSSFTALMALSASQTRENEQMVQNTLAERRRREEDKRKELERKERLEKEKEAKMRMKKLEEQQREKERQERVERERRAKEEELKRREEEQRNALMYGPKKSKLEYPSANSASRDELRRQRLPSPDESSGPSALTREEKRQRRMALEFRRSYGSSGRNSHRSGYGKAGRVLPGGAIDITTATPGSSGGDQGGHQSIKARLAAMPNTLTKLNVNKRDTRTIDEILQDRAKERESKVLAGDQAREFNDWFGSSKRKDKEKTTTRSATPLTGSNTPSQARSTKSASPGLFSDSETRPAPKKPSTAKASPSPASFPRSSALGSIKSSVSVKASVVNRPAPLDMKSLPSMRASGAKTPTSAVKATSKLSAISTASKQTSSSYASSSTVSKKRPRSPSYSPSPSPPPSNKRRAVSSGPMRGAPDLSSEIWKIFGKDRNSYMSRDVMSDDEDMEVDARFLEREEARSARIARKEDEIALEEEMRREEEKRRKKKEREARERAGGRN